MADPALDRMTQVIRSLVEIMQNGRLPAVDLQDEKAVLQAGGALARIGIGEAAGEGRATTATRLALLDLEAQGMLPPGQDFSNP